MKEETCEHSWIEEDRKKVISKHVQPGLFVDGFTEYQIRILQRCEKCNKLEVVSF